MFFDLGGHPERQLAALHAESRHQRHHQLLFGGFMSPGDVQEPQMCQIELRTSSGGGSEGLERNGSLISPARSFLGIWRLQSVPCRTPDMVGHSGSKRGEVRYDIGRQIRHEARHVRRSWVQLLARFGGSWASHHRNEQAVSIGCLTRDI